MYRQQADLSRPARPEDFSYVGHPPPIDDGPPERQASEQPVLPCGG